MPEQPPPPPTNGPPTNGPPGPPKPPAPAPAAPAPAATAVKAPAKKDEGRIAPPQKTYVPRPGLMDTIKDSQIWRSIFRHGYPNTVRNRSLAVLSNVFLHLHPVNVRTSGLRLSFTWCMGGLTFFLFLVETITGVLLMFYYRPTGEYAYRDIIALGEHVPMGIMREIHRWAAHAMVITVWLHMFRVFMTGSYKPPREFNWNIGVILLVLTLLLSFTGYLLPWDQLAIWAITVGSNMARATPIAGYEGPLASLITIDDVPLVHAGDDARFALLGGRFVGEATLLRFYVLHCIFIPLVAVILMAVHFWRIRKDGGISGPL
jgi:quinol-cytochrome oxidoreductase complex cytochrome b subunit